MSEQLGPAAHPMALIDVRGDAVAVNGSPVACEAGADRYAVAVHEVARRVATPLGRAVRALAIDEAGQTRLVVHPNGSASDVEPVETAERRHTEAGNAQLSGPTDELTSPPAGGRLPLRVVEARRAVDAAAMTDRGDRRSSETELAPITPTPATRTDGRSATRPSFITVGRTVQPAEQGWRGSLNRIGLRLNPGDEELSYRADVAAVSRHWPGTRTVAVANQKGSASKTPTSLCLAACFARFGGAGVLAWDNNETEGTMRFRTEWSSHEATLLDLLPRVEQLLGPSAAAAELSSFVHHQPGDKYDVLWSDTTIDGDHVVTAEDVAAIHRVASRYYRIVVMDSGNSNRASNWRAMIDQADGLVVPCTNVEDTAEVGARLLETLANRDERSARLARDALVVVSQRTRHSKNMDRIVAGFEGLAGRVVRIPYDPALETGVIRFGALAPATQRAWLAAAAGLTEAL